MHRNLKKIESHTIQDKLNIFTLEQQTNLVTHIHVQRKIKIEMIFSFYVQGKGQGHI